MPILFKDISVFPNWLILILVTSVGMLLSGCDQTTTTVVEDNPSALAASESAPGTSTAISTVDSDYHFEVKATSARLIRRVTGEVTSYVQGVPAEPVHSFNWDGEGVVPIEGEAQLEIDPVANTGEIKAKWTDEYGSWTYHQKMFAPPPHPSGLRVGPSASSTVLIEEDPVTTNAYLHGNTTAGEPVLPTLFNNLATWGPAEVTLNGTAFENPFDGPAPKWIGHTMTSVGVRGTDGTVRTTDGGIYNPLERTDNGVTDNDDLEYHIVFHDVPGPEMTENFPPPLSFFYHLQFEEVDIEIKASD